MCICQVCPGLGGPESAPDPRMKGHRGGGLESASSGTTGHILRGHWMLGTTESGTQGRTAHGHWFTAAPQAAGKFQVRRVPGPQKHSPALSTGPRGLGPPLSVPPQARAQTWPRGQACVPSVRETVPPEARQAFRVSAAEGGPGPGCHLRRTSQGTPSGRRPSFFKEICPLSFKSPTVRLHDAVSSSGQTWF